MRYLKKVGWVLARPFVWWTRLFRMPWFLCFWTASWVVYGVLRMEGVWRWVFPAFMLVMLVVNLLLGRMNRRLERRNAVLRAESAEYRAIFLARITSRGLPVEVAHRVADLIEEDRIDDAISLTLKHQPPVE